MICLCISQEIDSVLIYYKVNSHLMSPWLCKYFRNSGVTKFLMRQVVEEFHPVIWFALMLFQQH